MKEKVFFKLLEDLKIVAFDNGKFDKTDPYLETIVEVLTEEFLDNKQLIHKYVYELNFGEDWTPDNKIDISNPTTLYQKLTESKFRKSLKEE